MIPKTLIISTWAPPMIGGPMNLYNIFSQFSKDTYCVLTSYFALVNSTSKSQYWLTGKYFFYDKPNSSQADILKIKIKAKKRKNEKKIQNCIINLILKIFYFKGIGNLLIMIPQILAIVRHGVKVVKREKIDLLMGISGNGAEMISTYIIHKLTKRPYTFWLFDIYKGNNFVPALKWLAANCEPTLFRHAAKIFLTNEATENLYRKRYGNNISYEKIYNSVFPENYQKKQAPYHPVSPFTILFTGHIYWPQEQSVLNLIKAVKMINDIDLRLKIYAPNYPSSIEKEIKDINNIILTSAPPSEMPTIQSQADLLFLPLSWNTGSPDIIATATPGKFTDYLAAGKPMLVHAPDYAYISQYARDNQLGVVVDKNDIHLLADAIVDFFNNPGKGNIYIQNSLKIFHQNHDARQNAKKLIKSLEMV